MNEFDAAQGPREKSPVRWEIAATVLLVVSSFLALSAGIRQGGPGPEVLGRALRSVVFTLVVVGVFRLFGKARTRRSRAVIAFWTLVVLLIGQFGTVVQQVVPTIEGLKAGESLEWA